MYEYLTNCSDLKGHMNVNKDEKNGASIKYGRKKVTAMYPKIENEMTCTQNNKEVNPLIMFSCFDSTWV